MSNHVSKKILQVIAILHILMGLLLPVLVSTGLLASYLNNLAITVGGPSNPIQVAFLAGLFGPTIASWGVLFLLSINQFFAHPTQQTWWLLIAACLCWALYDSYLSFIQGMYLHVLLNGVVLLLMFVPLWFARRLIDQAT